MTFTPSIQALLGAHTSTAFIPDNIAINWVRNEAYIVPQVGNGTNYLAVQNILTGVEDRYAVMDSFGSPYTGAGNAPVGLDHNGNIYLTYNYLGYGGGVIQIDPDTLIQTGVTAGNAPLPYGFYGTAYYGHLTYAYDGSNEFMVAITDLSTGLPDHGFFVSSPTAFAGRQVSYPSGATSGACCPGKQNSGKAYVVNSVRRTQSGTQVLTLYEVTALSGGSWVPGDWPTQNSQVTAPIVGTVAPTDIDAGWTEIYEHGCVVDQTDGNILVSLEGQSAATNFRYIAKLDVTNASVIWKTQIPGVSGDSSVGSNQMQWGSINNQIFAVLVNTSSTNTCVTLNTSDGSIISSTSTNFGGLGNFGTQCYNDSLGAIILYINYTAGAGAPTQLNSTPSTFSGWAVLYVNSPPVPTPATGTHATYLRIWGNWH